MKQKLIVISADGLVNEDVESMAGMPNFSRYFANCSRVRQMRSIYPTITYPCHTTMCTGVYPEKHHVCGNLDFHPGEEKQPWKWFHRYNKWDEDIFKAAKRNGLTTAAIFWPVTAGHPSIDHLIAEYWPQSPGQSLEDAFRESGSSEDVLRIIRRNIAGVEIRKHPSTDDFMIRCACDFIREFQPDLLMMHPGNVDGYRHNYGVFNDKTARGVEETDRYVGEIMRTLEETGLAKSSNVVLTSDHGLIDVNRVIHLNVLLAEAGLLEVDSEGKLARWDAFCQSGGTSALIYINSKASDSTWERTHTLLKTLRDEGSYGISQVFTREEISALEHLDGDFAFVVETDGHTAFGDRLIPPLVTSFDNTDYRYGKATHGHLPDKGPQPVFLATGPGFRENVVLPRRPLVDGAPTYAKLLCLDLRDADGRPMEELLR